MLNGIDCSNHQGVIDWAAVAGSGVQFAIIKASESYDYEDPYLAANWSGAKANGLKVGAYHFARPESGTADANATQFLVAVADLDWAPGDLAVLDLESGRGDQSAWVQRWLDVVEDRLGVVPCIYSNVPQLGAARILGDVFNRYPLWLASYKTSTDVPAVCPPGWDDRYILWQWSESGHVPGIAGNCDLDVLLSDDIADLTKWGKPEPAPEPAPEATMDTDAIRAALDVIWDRLTRIQASASGTTTESIDSLAEEAKQLGVVAVKVAAGLA